MIEWRFKPNPTDDINVDPIQAEFFTTRDISNTSTAIVREGIQNALDEKSRDEKTETVKVRIFLSGDQYSVPSSQYLPLLDTLLPHLKSESSGLASLPDFNSPMRFLVFEDFNTTGLEGKPEEHYAQGGKDKLPHNFYYFWRNVGRSGKTDDKLGRWGLGKTVFPASSQINTFWGVTVRKSDQRKLLMGQSILRLHDLEGGDGATNVYKPYGMFGDYKDAGFFALPVENEKEVENFETLFKLERNKNTGLSLIIPFCSDEITIDNVAYSVIEQYFYPILEGRLEVEVSEGDREIILKRDLIRESIDKIDFEKISTEDIKKTKGRETLLKLFDFAEYSFNVQEDDFFSLNSPKLKSTPRWSKALFEDEITLEKFREKFENNERVAFRIPLKYHPINGEAKICWYKAFLEKDISLNKPENTFVRDGITISGMASLDKGLVRGMVIIHDKDLAHMLGDSENPAHTEWQSDSRNFKGKYNHGKEVLAFVQNTLKKLYENLQRPLDGIQKDLLIDFFSIPIETSEEKKTKDLLDDKSFGDENVEEPDIIPLVSKKRAYLVEKVASGLKIKINPDAMEVPDSLYLKLGYDVPRGNPIKSYQELDFDISKPPVKVESTGVYFTRKERNELEFDIEDKSFFEITLTGFDERRDLFLKLQ